MVSTLWALPVAIVAVGMIAVAAAARGAAAAIVDLRSATAALREVGDAVGALHDDAIVASESFAALRRTRAVASNPDR